MKKWCFAALALANTALTTTFAQLPNGYGIHYSPQELAVWRQRAVSGPYRVTGDQSPFSPGDWNRTVTFANAFKANPFNAGNDNLEARQIWTGWTQPITPGNEQVPVWQGFKMQAAAFYYLIKGDTSYGNAVRRALLFQTTIPAAQIGNAAGFWNPTTTPYEAGFFEANWLIRLLTCYDYTKNLFSPAERLVMDNWFRVPANYYCNRTTIGPIGQCFPRRLQDDYTVLSRDAQPGGIPSYADPIYPRSTAIRHAWSPDGYIYTHINSDSSLGNRVSRLAMHYNNRQADKMSFVGLLGVFLNDTFYKLHARQYAKEWIRYSVYLDGTYGEYERNGDYNNPNQGFQYGAKNIAQYVLLADALARKGDFSLYQYTTSQGAHNTVGGPKSLLTVLTRYANNCIGASPIYNASVSPENRIDNFVEGTGKMVVWDYLIAIANKYYQSDFLKQVYRHTASGSIPFNNNYTSVGGVWVAWNGPSGEMPGVLFMNGLMENLNVYQHPCGIPSNLSANGVGQTSATVAWDAVSLVQRYRVRYRVNGSTTWILDSTSSSSISLSGLSAQTNYQVQVQTLCQAGNASGWSATFSFTTQQPLCQVPQNLRVTAITNNSAEVVADVVPGATGYTLDLREQGSPTWTSVAVASLPITLSLASSTTYEVRIRANCSGTNRSDYSDVVAFSTSVPPCPTPGSLQANTFGSDSASMSWASVAGASQYKLRFKPVSSANWKFVVVSTIRYNEGSLLPGTRYEFQVMTDCQAGNSSAFTGSAFFTTGVPPCPTVAGLTVGQISQNTASVSYTSLGAAAFGYNIRYRRTGATAWTVVSDAASPLALQGLTPSTQYEVQARALCSADSSAYSASVLFTTATITCGTPTSFSAGSVTQTSATLSWAPVAGASGYEVQYRSGQGTFTTLTTAIPVADVTGLTPSTIYDARVRTICSGNSQSVYSALITFTTQSPVCQAPTGLSFTGISGTQATINWTVLPFVSAYNLRYRPAGQSTWTDVNAASSPYALSGLAGATQYEVQVQAVCSAGNLSEFTSSVSFSTVGQVCYTPINLTATVMNEDSVYITWSGIPGNQGYKVVFYDASNPNGLRYSDTVYTHRSGFTGLIPGQHYGFRVMTLCPFGSSFWSAPVMFTMPAGCTANGAVRKEIWTNLSWQAGQSVPQRTPDAVEPIASLEDSTRLGTGNLVARVKGHICPPATGTFSFYLSGSEAAELYISTIGADSTSRQRIASVSRATAFRQFNSQPSATSQPVRLVQGQRYYLEVIYGSQNGYAHFSMAWKTPLNADAVTLITASRFTSSAGPASPMVASEGVTSRMFSLYPNPSSNSAPVFLQGPEGETQVKVMDASGKLAWQGTMTLGSSAEALPASRLKSGLYMVQVSGRRGLPQTLRMVVQ